MEKELLLQVKNLQISWLLDKALIPIVCGLDFSLKSGKVLALVGESGCGKSVTSLSLLRLLAKELKIVGGEILFYGQNGEETLDMAKVDPRGKDIQKIRGGAVSMIFQEPMSSFSPLYTIGYQIMEVIQLHKDISKKEAKRITVELLKKVGIADAKNAVNRYPYEFSGGMRQRAMIAKALSCNPLLLIADEPTTALDVTIQNQILNLMCDMKQEFRTSIIFITHDLGVVGQMADEVAIMYMGNIIEQGTTREIFKNPKRKPVGVWRPFREMFPVCLIARPAVHFVPGAIILCPVFVILLFQISGKFLKTIRLPVICTDMERVIDEYINGY